MANTRRAEWKGWNDTMPVEVVTSRGTEVFENLAAAKAKHPTLDPRKNTRDFTWAMYGQVRGRPAIRFEDWPTQRQVTMAASETLLKRTARLALENEMLRPKLMPLIRQATAGGTVSWKVLLGGDPRNWQVNWQESDGRSWNDIVRQIAAALEKMRTPRRGTVEAVRVERDTLKVYVEYDSPMDAEDALYDAEAGIGRVLKELGDRDTSMEWVIHGTVDDRSNLVLTDEAIESGF